MVTVINADTVWSSHHRGLAQEGLCHSIFPLPLAGGCSSFVSVVAFLFSCSCADNTRI